MGKVPDLPEKIRKWFTLVTAPVFLLCLIAPAFAQTEEEMDVLRMIYKDEDLVTSGRSAKPISQVAENITVIDAEEIEAINAHTLAEVLYHVPGVQMDMRGGPGALAGAMIQGSDQRHVQVMVDGVSLNNLSDNVVDIAAIPVQQIQRIEIIKGPASSSWGSSLGGIINVITKSPDPDRKGGGVVSASIGERNSGDYRGELSGTVGSFGYYIYGGGLTGDGLTPNTATNKGDLYTKLAWQGSDKAHLQFSLSYNNGTRTDGQSLLDNLNLSENFEYFFSTLTFSYAISDNFDFDISGRVSKRKNNAFLNALDSGAELNRQTSDELNAGGSAKITWRSGLQSLVVGSDYDNGAMDSPSIKDRRQKQVRWAVFANGTLSRWNFALTPGVRYDHTSTSGSFISPSVGLTYTLLEKTIFRGYVARGFNTPALAATFGDGFFSVANPGLKMEKVWSYSLGVETAALKYFWLKATGFQHDISDVIGSETLPEGTFRYVNSGKQRRRGVETEIKTVPLYKTSLMAGYTYLEVTDRQTGQRIQNFPTWTLDMGVDYAYGDLFRGALRGHYIWWNADPTMNASYHAMIWDLNLSSRVLEKGDNAVELFFTAHNLFNGSQYSFGLFSNARRWFEGGVKWRF